MIWNWLSWKIWDLCCPTPAARASSLVAVPAQSSNYLLLIFVLVSTLSLSQPLTGP